MVYSQVDGLRSLHIATNTSLNIVPLGAKHLVRPCVCVCTCVCVHGVVVKKMKKPKIMLSDVYVTSSYVYWFTGNDPANEETPNST